MAEPKTQPIITPTKILVVDDHPNAATMLARGIAQLGNRVDVTSATSGRQALEFVDKGAIDILFTDMIMPDMTGLELIEKLQNHPAGRPTFTYLVTAFDVPGLKVTARRLKVKDVIIKPVHPERICQIVLQAINEMDHTRPVVGETSQTEPFTILIADDQPDNLMLLARYLEKEGYSYIKAKDGLETLEKTRNHMPDLILLDVNMPHKDGFAVLEEIRADPAIEHIPVIILTAARLEPAQIQSGLNMGADDYITKPFDRRELLARIRTKLRVKQAEDVIRRRNRELNLLPEIGKELSARFNIDELATILLKRTGETLGAMLSHVLILNPDGPYEKTQYFDTPQTSAESAGTYSLPERLLEIANDAHQGFVVEDTQHDERWVANETDRARSAVVVPMFGRHHLLGLLLLVNEQPHYFNLEHLLLLQAICSQASIAIENAQLYDKMAQEQQRLAAVLQGAADAILMFDNENRLSMVNPAGQRLFTDVQVTLGQPLRNGKGYDELIDLVEEMRGAGASVSREIGWPDRRVFSAALTPVKEGGCVVVLHDVSHFKELERVKDEFIATASHDLRNPITSIGGYSQLIKQAGPLNEVQLDFAQRIHSAATNMQELVENMMNLAKMDLHAESRREELEVNPLVREIADEFQPQAEAKRQLLSLGETISGLKVHGDPLQLRQAFRNLIGNAIKYTPECGTIMVSLEETGTVATIQIQDTGYGIPATDLPHIFDRFYRVRNNGHDEIDGNGLGLAIVQSIIEKHDGQISVESEIGKGSCFTVLLPLVSIEFSTDHATTLPQHSSHDQNR
jgi:signal transduction histidine kinase/DNA-binding response OmpR family regulator